MRGKQANNVLFPILRRITPADAGKTPLDCAFAPPKTDHPRGCGENLQKAAGYAVTGGSPPRMRGKPCCYSLFLSVFRITPADAGKTFYRTLICFCYADHPRGCGENPHNTAGNACFYGSPPRMRGKLVGQNANGVPLRITPADAGKTSARLSITVSTSDHPRGCGENHILLHSSSRYSGSPPRMRGKLYR